MVVRAGLITFGSSNGALTTWSGCLRTISSKNLTLFIFGLYNIVMKCVFIDLNACHSCSANYEEEDKEEEEEEEEEESHSQQTRRTSTERLREDSYSEDVTTKNLKAMPRSSKDQLSPSKSARITSCGRFDPQKLLVM